MATLGATTAVLRIFDVAKAHEFYVAFLGFEVRPERRFGTPWQTREISVTDPFGNRLHFFEEMPGYQRRPKSRTAQ